MANTGEGTRRGNPAALHYSKCLGVKREELSTKESGFRKEQSTQDEQPRSSPREIFNVLKHLSLKPYWNQSKGLCEYHRGKKFFSLAVSISNELLPPTPTPES